MKYVMYGANEYFAVARQVNVKYLFRTLYIALAILAVSGTAIAQSNPPVKKSKSGICHAEGGTYYSRTKTFTPYSSMDACLKSGGRRPKK